MHFYAEASSQTKWKL